MRLILLSVIFLLTINVKGQDFANRTYNWGSVDSFYISDEDKKLDAIILKDNRIREYFKDENGLLKFNTLVHKVIFVNQRKHKRIT